MGFHINEVLRPPVRVRRAVVGSRRIQHFNVAAQQCKLIAENRAAAIAARCEIAGMKLVHPGDGTTHSEAARAICHRVLLGSQKGYRRYRSPLASRTALIHREIHKLLCVDIGLR